LKIDYWKLKIQKPPYRRFLLYPNVVVIRRSNKSLARFRPSQQLYVGIKILPRKEVIHPQIPLRIPCYDLALLTNLTFSQQSQDSGPADSARLTGGVCKTRERIHRSVADLRLLAIPAS